MPELLLAFFFFHPLPIQIFPFLFQDYQYIVHAAILKAEMQKILSLSDHEASVLHTSNTESLDGIAFFPICSWTGDIQHLSHKSETGNTDTFKFILFAFGNNMSPPFTLEFSFHQIPKEPYQDSQAHPPNTVDHSSLRRNTYGITSMLPNQNISILMASLPTEFSGTHSHIITTSPLFLLLWKPSTAAKITEENSKVCALEINTNDDISDIDLFCFTHITSTTLAPTLIGKELEKELETVSKVFPELSDNSRNPAIVPFAYHSTTHTSPSTNHYSNPSIAHVHRHTIRCTITTSNNIPEAAINMLWTTSTTIWTTTFSIEPVTSHKQHSIKESAHITTPKRTPPTLDIFSSIDFRLKCLKE